MLQTSRKHKGRKPHGFVVWRRRQRLCLKGKKRGGAMSAAEWQ